VARLINASSAREIVFTRNATEAINLVAHSWGNAHLRPGDEVRSPVLHPVCTAGLSTVPSLLAGVEAGGVSGPLKRAGRAGAGVGGGAPQQPGALAAGLPAHGRAAAPRPADGRHAGAGHAGARPCGAASHSPPSILLPPLRGTAWHGALSARCAQALTQMLSPKTKIVALVAVSNMLGSILDTAYVAEQAHRVRPWASEGVSPCASCAPSCAVWPGEVALWHCPSAGRGESVRSACQMRLEVHAVRRAPGGRWAPGCCWTAARRCRTCRWTCGAWARTGSWPPRTRCAGRPASASCGAGPRGAGSCAAAAPLACCQAGACKSGIASLL